MRTQQERTGIFFPYSQSQRLVNFQSAFVGILNKENVHFYDGACHNAHVANNVIPVTEDILSEIHSKDMIEAVKATRDFEAASYSAGVTVQAADEICQGNSDNAFVSAGFGDHHAERDYFGGMCFMFVFAIGTSTITRII